MRSKAIHAAARFACSMYASPDLAGTTVTVTISSASASFSTGGLYTIFSVCLGSCSLRLECVPCPGSFVGVCVPLSAEDRAPGQLGE